MKRWRRAGFISSLLLMSILLGGCPLVSASTFQSSSPSYGVNEVFFGSGGDLNECSNNYCAKVAAGELAVGAASSNNFQEHAGFNTTDLPVLDFFVNGGPINLGVLNGGLVSDGSTTFTVLDYVSSGYNIILTGTPPTASLPAGGNHTLTAMSSAAASSAGTEQFGINLVNNTSPNVGTNPQQVPDSTFGFGAASSGYNTSNQFKFNAGDTVAASTKATGETQYTLSVIANISNSTPSGLYSGQIGLVAVATF